MKCRINQFDCTIFCTKQITYYVPSYPRVILSEAAHRVKGRTRQPNSAAQRTPPQAGRQQAGSPLPERDRVTHPAAPHLPPNPHPRNKCDSRSFFATDLSRDKNFPLPGLITHRDPSRVTPRKTVLIRTVSQTRQRKVQGRGERFGEGRNPLRKGVPPLSKVFPLTAPRQR